MEISSSRGLVVVVVVVVVGVAEIVAAVADTGEG